MQFRIILAGAFLLARLLAPADIQFRASWDTPTSATVRWTQPERSCLWRKPAGSLPIFIRCFDGAGDRTVKLGMVGPFDGQWRPRTGDVYLLDVGGSIYRAPLMQRPQLLPLIRA